jgi:hypothetical protein
MLSSRSGNVLRPSTSRLPDREFSGEAGSADQNTGPHRQAQVDISESTKYWPDSPWLAFSPDGNVLGAASSPGDTDHVVRLWDITNQPRETCSNTTTTGCDWRFSCDDWSGRVLDYADAISTSVERAPPCV